MKKMLDHILNRKTSVTVNKLRKQKIYFIIYEFYEMFLA